MVNTEDKLLNYRQIALSSREGFIHPDDESIAWGIQTLDNLNFQSLRDSQKAQIICDFLNDNFTYNFKRRTNIREIIKKKGGNCVSHSLMGIFLLRLAGIPAKTAHEIHITREYMLISLYVGMWARKENNGINSFWHNDHVWVWFRNAETWHPFDSALNLCGFDQFYKKRFFQQKKLSKGFAQKWTGPPFVIWEGSGEGLSAMNNVTASLINPDTMKDLIGREEWLEFVDLFADWHEDDFLCTYLPDRLISRVRKISRKWFGNGIGC